MKRFYILLIASLFVSAGIRAQQQQTGGASLTLAQCIQYALENSVNIQNSVLDERISVAKVNETIGIGLPQINGNASVNHNQQLRRFFTTYSPNGFIKPDPVPVGLNTGDVLSAQNFFQLRSAAEAGLTVNQIIFNGSYIVGLQASKAYKDLAIKTTVQTKEQTIEQVTKAFYFALINRERMDLFANNITRVDSLLRNTQALNTNGFAERIDVDRVQVSLNNLITEKDNFERQQILSLELLKFQMNYPIDQPLEIVGELTPEMVKVNLDDYLKGWNYVDRSDYKILEANKKLQELNLKNNYAAAVPSISAFANFGYNTQSNNISGLFKTNTQIGEQSSGFGPDKYYPFTLYGVSLNVPIFSGLQRTYRVQQEKLRLQKIENSFKTVKSGIDLQIKQAITGYENNLKALESQNRNIELAGNVARVTKIKYEQGVGSNLEVVDAESALRGAQINYYNSLYDVMVAKVDMDKAFGRLLQNPQSR